MKNGIRSSKAVGREASRMIGVGRALREQERLIAEISGGKNEHGVEYWKEKATKLAQSNKALREDNRRLRRTLKESRRHRMANIPLPDILMELQRRTAK